MKTIIISFILLFLFSGGKAQQWEWAKPVRSSSAIYDHTRLKRLSSGELVCLLTEAYPDQPSRIVCASPVGDTLWCFSNSRLVINDLCVGNNTIALIGNFQDSLEIGNQIIKSNGGNDVFVALLDANGVIIRYKTFGSNRGEYGNAICLDGGKIIVAGNFVRNFSIDTVHFHGYETGADVFIAILDSTLGGMYGNQTKSQGECALSVVVDKKHQPYLFARSWASVQIADSTLYISEDGLFLARFNESLTLQRLRRLTYTYMDGPFWPEMLFNSRNELTMGYTEGHGGGGYSNMHLYTWDENERMISNIQTPSGREYMDIDSNDGIWLLGLNFAIAYVSSNYTLTYFAYDPQITDVPNGIVAGENNDCYVLGSCRSNSAPVAGYTCTGWPEFMAHYTINTLGDKTFSEREPLIFPNPVNDKIKIDGEKLFSRYSIKDMHGAAIRHGMVQGDSIDLTELAQGAYLLELYDGHGGSRKIKLIKL